MGVRQGAISQQARASVNQTQNSIQLNTIDQFEAVAIADEGSIASSQQSSEESNNNEQVGVAVAQNTINDFNSESNIEQIAEAAVEQFQDVQQENFASQEDGIAEASAESQATSSQQAFQSNENAQVGIAEAENTQGTNTVSQSPLSKYLIEQHGILNSKNNDRGNSVNQEAVLSFNGIKLTVSVEEQRKNLRLQAMKNGQLSVDEVKELNSMVKSLKTDSTASSKRIVITTEEICNPSIIELTKDGEILWNGEKIAFAHPQQER